MNIDKIGTFIKELRIKKGYSQNKLGEELHVTRQAISNWENGKAIPDSDILIKLSEIFNVSINEILLGGKNNKKELEKITLNLVDENNKKTSKIKRIITLFSLSIIMLLFLFLGYYFISNYNSIKVYTVTGESEKFLLKEGIIITTAKKNYIRIGNIIPKFEENVKNAKLYTYEKNKQKKVLYEIDENIGISLEIITNIKDSRKRLLNNLYLTIYYDDEKEETMKLVIDEDFKNGFITDQHRQKLLEDMSLRKMNQENRLEKMIQLENEEYLKNMELRNRELNKDEPEESKLENSICQNEEKNEIIKEEQKEEVENPPKETKQTIEEETQKEEVENPPKETEQTIVEETQVENKEELKENPTEENNSNEIDEISHNNESIENEINYHEIIAILEEKGIDDLGKKSINFQNEGKDIFISNYLNDIYVETLYDNMIESWNYDMQSNYVQYNQYINFEETENRIFYLPEENDEKAVTDMNEILRIFLKMNGGK